MDNKKSLLFSIIAVVLMGVIISGGSFAYFVWTSGTSDRSTVNITIEQSGITMHIETEQKTMGGLRPTRDCNNANAYVDATVTVVNNTGAAAVPSFKLKTRVIKGGTDELTQAALSHIHYNAVNLSLVDEPSCDSFSNESYDGLSGMLFSGVWSTHLTFESVNTNGSWTHIPNIGDVSYDTISSGSDTSIWASLKDAYLPRQYYYTDVENCSGDDYCVKVYNKGDVNGVTFVAPPHATTTHRLRVYVWLDDAYTATTIGNVVSDPLQNAQIEINFSEQSIIQQVSSDLIGGGAVTPNSKAAGFYDEEGNYTSWDTLVANGDIAFEDGVLYGASNLTGELVISDSVTQIIDSAFYESSLTSVVISDSVTYIGDGAFMKCSLLSSAVIGKSVTWIGSGAFLHTPLTEVYYEGTEEEWNAIEKVPNWNDGSSITKVICSDGTINLT